MENELKVKDKEVVVPGEVLAIGMSYLPSFGTYRRGDQIIANRLGLLTIEGKVIKTIPLSGKYIPKRNDVVLGRVLDILISGWRIELNSPYTGVLGLKDATFEFVAKGDDLTRFYDLDDYVVAKIINVTSQNLIDMTMKGPGLRRLHGGQIIEVSTHKVPRIIGKKGSMVGMIKQATGCKIIVGQNGWVWLEGAPEQELLAVQTIRKIEDESHIPGLTDRIKAFLEEKTGKKIVDQPMPQEYDDHGMEDQQFDSEEGEGRGRFPPRERSPERGDRGERGFGDRGFGDRGGDRGGFRPRQDRGFGDRGDRGFNRGPPRRFGPPGAGPRGFGGGQDRGFSQEPYPTQQMGQQELQPQPRPQDARDAPQHAAQDNAPAHPHEQPHEHKHPRVAAQAPSGDSIAPDPAWPEDKFKEE